MKGRHIFTGEKMENNDNGLDTVNEYFKNIGVLVKEIDRKEEASLWKRAQKGDKKAKTRLTQMHLRLVVPTAKRFLRRGMELMDLIEEGNLGLIHAVDKFDPSKGYRFSTYAIHWIEQYIRRAAEEQAGTIKIPSHAWENLRLWSKTWDSMKEQLGRDPSLKEMASKLSLSARQVHSILDTLSAAYSVDSLSSAVNEEEENTLGDTIADEREINPDDLFTNKSSNKVLLSILDEIFPRDKQVLIMRFGIETENPLTLAEVSKKLGISRERVRQIEERAVRNVRKRAQILGLIEHREKDFATKKIHTGMRIKQGKDVLGDDIIKDKLTKLINRSHKGLPVLNVGVNAVKKTSGRGPLKKCGGKTNRKFNKDKKK